MVILPPNIDPAIVPCCNSFLFKEYRNEIYENNGIGSANELESWLKENQIDVAVLLDKQWNVPEITVQLCQEEPLCLFVSPDHPLVGADNVLPHDVSSHPMLLISNSSCWKNIFQEVMEEANEPFRIMLETASISDLKQFAVLGFGIAVLPLYAVNQELESNQLSMINWKGGSFRKPFKSIGINNKKLLKKLPDHSVKFWESIHLIFR